MAEQGDKNSQSQVDKYRARGYKSQTPKHYEPILEKEKNTPILQNYGAFFQARQENTERQQIQKKKGSQSCKSHSKIN